MYTGKARITVAHKNVPNMIGAITAVLAKENLNIDNMVNTSNRGDWAYTLIDLDSLQRKGTTILVAELKKLDGVVSVRIVQRSVKEWQFMATVRPFKAVRPAEDMADKIAALPYDVMNTAEAREMVKGKPYSFLHVDRGGDRFAGGYRPLQRGCLP